MLVQSTSKLCPFHISKQNIFLGTDTFLSKTCNYLHNLNICIIFLSFVWHILYHRLHKVCYVAI